jgi:hypothetical protein
VKEQKMNTLMKSLAVAAMTVAMLAPARATTSDRVPLQFVGTWCRDKNAPETYKRANKCESAHEPEDNIVLRSDRLLISDVIECKFLEIVSITRHGTHRLKFWCKSNQLKDETWLYEIWISAPGRNKLGIQDVKDGF